MAKLLKKWRKVYRDGLSQKIVPLLNKNLDVIVKLSTDAKSFRDTFKLSTDSVDNSVSILSTTDLKGHELRFS